MLERNTHEKQEKKEKTINLEFSVTSAFELPADLWNFLIDEYLIDQEEQAIFNWVKEVLTRQPIEVEQKVDNNSKFLAPVWSHYTLNQIVFLIRFIKNWSREYNQENEREPSAAEKEVILHQLVNLPLFNQFPLLDQKDEHKDNNHIEFNQLLERSPLFSKEPKLLLEVLENPQFAHLALATLLSLSYRTLRALMQMRQLSEEKSDPSLTAQQLNHYVDQANKLNTTFTSHGKWLSSYTSSPKNFKWRDNRNYQSLIHYCNHTMNQVLVELLTGTGEHSDKSIHEHTLRVLFGSLRFRTGVRALTETDINLVISIEPIYIRALLELIDCFGTAILKNKKIMNYFIKASDKFRELNHYSFPIRDLVDHVDSLVLTKSNKLKAIDGGAILACTKPLVQLCVYESKKPTFKLKSLNKIYKAQKNVAKKRRNISNQSQDSNSEPSHLQPSLTLSSSSERSTLSEDSSSSSQDSQFESFSTGTHSSSEGPYLGGEIIEGTNNSEPFSLSLSSFGCSFFSSPKPFLNSTDKDMPSLEQQQQQLMEVSNKREKIKIDQDMESEPESELDLIQNLDRAPGLFSRQSNKEKTGANYESACDGLYKMINISQALSDKLLIQLIDCVQEETKRLIIINRKGSNIFDTEPLMTLILLHLGPQKMQPFLERLGRQEPELYGYYRVNYLTAIKNFSGQNTSVLELCVKRYSQQSGSNIAAQQFKCEHMLAAADEIAQFLNKPRASLQPKRRAK